LIPEFWINQAALIFTRPSAVGQRGASSGKVEALSILIIGLVKKDPADQESLSLGSSNIPFAARSCITALRT
jgi:hypothetical protein